MRRSGQTWYWILRKAFVGRCVLWLRVISQLEKQILGGPLNDSKGRQTQPLLG